MNKREYALLNALQKNEENSQRWQMFLEENETAIQNMNMFGKCLTIDVMVPVGKKALMPGHLQHTNEVLVGHYQGYFSKCTTSKATEICEFRIKMAKEHLKNFATEANLWQNKLDKPYAEGVIPNGEEREIIEEFNEETEKSWKEKHKIRVKQAKQKEREERVRLQKENTTNDNNCKEKTDGEIFKLLEEAELMEELEQELNKLELDEVNGETIRKLMSGDIKLPQEKKRLAHGMTHQRETTDKTSLSPNIVKRNDIRQSTQINANNNEIPNPDIINLLSSHNEDIEECEDEQLPKEVTLIKEQSKFLSLEDQIGFFEYQIQIIKQKIRLLPLRTQQELNEKIRLINVLEYLEELLEETESIVGSAELVEKDTDEEDVKNNKYIEIQEKEITKSNETNCNNTSLGIVTNGCDNENIVNQKRRISFALKDNTLEFKKHEAVTQMLSSKIEKSQRDIIKLNNNNEQKEICELKSEEPLNKRNLIQVKVKQNLEFMAENQSKQDFDLVQKILQSSVGDINTLHIKFKHSQQDGCLINDKGLHDIPGNPSEIYNLYIKCKKSVEIAKDFTTLFVNSYEGEDEVKVPVLKETDRQVAFADPKSEFSNPIQAKSILKNKSSVDKENHYEDTHQGINRNSKLKAKSKKWEDDCLSTYHKVMKDVVEKPITEPEPLPDGKFIDAHTPKKRVSRFKQMRQGKNTT